MQLETEEYMTIERVNAVRERAGKLRRQFLKYKDAEIIYSLTHRKLLEMADEAGAIYRIDGTVLINRDIFDEYLEQFHQKLALYFKLGVASSSLSTSSRVSTRGIA